MPERGGQPAPPALAAPVGASLGPVTQSAEGPTDVASRSMDQGAGRSAIKTVAGIILANLVCQGIVLGIGLARHVNLLTALRLSLASGLMFYGGVAAWAAVRA